MFGRGREELKKSEVSVRRSYFNAVIVMSAYILGALLEVMIRMAVGFVFFALLVVSLFPYLGLGLNDEAVKIVFITGLAFVFCEIAFTVGNSLVEFIYLADIEDSDIEEI